VAGDVPLFAVLLPLQILFWGSVDSVSLTYDALKRLLQASSSAN
jgi:hypothetical protein